MYRHEDRDRQGRARQAARGEIREVPMGRLGPPVGAPRREGPEGRSPSEPSRLEAGRRFRSASGAPRRDRRRRLNAPGGLSGVLPPPAYCIRGAVRMQCGCRAGQCCGRRADASSCRIGHLRLAGHQNAESAPIEDTYRALDELAGTLYLHSYFHVVSSKLDKSATYYYLLPKHTTWTTRIQTILRLQSKNTIPS